MISGKILRDAIISGANNINNQRSRVDELNVFPVPDGDTGTNMGMTVGAAVRELEALDDSCTVGEAAKTAASAMLRGARGNSGVITSLLFRGFSKALEGKKEADVADIVAALQKGVEGAYKAVMKPTEGTILTVARVASEEAAASDAADVPALWDVVLTAGQKALEDTPNLLPVLKKAGVVDAGGQGIMVIFEGMGKVFHGEGIIAGGEAAPNKAKLSTENAGKGVFTDDLMKVEDITNGYCTQFLINKYEGASAAKMRAFAESNGDSVVCIEDDDVINLHVHTADPGKILSEAIKYGYLTNFKIENMHEQFLARQKQGKSLEKQASAEKAPSQASEFIYAAVDPSRDYGFVAVAAGEGLKAVFEFCGGVPTRLVFDNATGVGRRVGQVVSTADTFTRFAAHYGFDFSFCNPNSGHEKGSVENAVGAIRRNLFVPVPRIDSLPAYNKRILGRCLDRAGKDHYLKGEPERQLFMEDCVAMADLPAKPFRVAKIVTAKTDKYGDACLDGRHRYPLGPDHGEERVIVELGAFRVAFYDGEGTQIAAFDRAYGDAPTKASDPMSQLALLCRKPGGWQNSAVRATLPKSLARSMDSMGRADRGTMLRMLRDVSADAGYEAAVAAMAALGADGGVPSRADVALAAACTANGQGSIAYDDSPDLGMYDAVFAKEA